MSAERFEQLIQRIIPDNVLHGRWINTLSLMENTGARKISAGQDPLKVDELVLKHAAEEARHAYALKRQLRKLGVEGFADYSPETLLAPLDSYRYLHRLDMRVSRYLQQELHLTGRELRYAAYLLVTYAIEVQADAVYGVYERCLKAHKSPVSVRAILVEEEQHLAEMHRQMADHLPDWETHAAWACEVENQLCEQWLSKVEQQLAVAAAA